MASRRTKIHKTVSRIQPEVKQGTLSIERLAHGGHGVGYLHGLAVFVPRTAPGDVVEVRVVTQRRRYAFGEMVAVHQTSPWRVQPPCPFYDDCGGCQLQHVSYAQQLASKTADVRGSLERIGKLPEVPVAPTLGSPSVFAYRNKILYHYDRQRGALGLVDRHGERILDIQRCLISDPRADAVMERIRALLTNQPALRQVLRQVQVQVGQRTAEVLVTVIVSATLSAAVQQQLWKGLHDLATGLYMHVKQRDTPAVFDGTSTLLAGAPAIHERLAARLLRIEPQTFFQVNSMQMECLDALVHAAAALQGQEIVLDLYSGGGAMALLLAPYCAQVYAVEVNRQASLLAMQHATQLGVENCHFRTGKVERILYRYLAQRLHADVAILDPPRAGCHPEALRALASMGIPRLIYISCSPPTLARDLRLLHDLGYRTLGVQPLDMFPQTYHIECVATLTRVSA
jgi:23S rRNA (uracil1939-C5)-methyltransferase